MYDNEPIESNLYVFLYGAFGSGKGALRHARQIVAPIHKYLRETEIQPPPDSDLKPEKKMLFIPANNSKSGFIELLAANGRGLIYEPEADTLSDILKQDYANFSDILRLAYHHEPIRFYRRLNKEFYEIETPFLSVLLSGTPDQLKRFIPSIENGLFSRFMFYELKTETDFKNVFDNSKGDLNYHFYQIGEQLLQLFKPLYHATEPIYFKLTPEQQNDFLNYFRQLKQELINNYGIKIIGEVHRFAVQLFRTAMILTALRQIETGHVCNICSDTDYQTAKQIFEVFKYHALNLFETLEAYSLDDLPQNKRSLYDSLPVQFQTSEAITNGLQYDFSEPTIKRFLKNNKLFVCVKHGHYKKKYE